MKLKYIIILISSTILFGSTNFSEEKGILPLVKYFNNSNYPFIIAGDGPQKSEKKEKPAGMPTHRTGVGNIKNQLKYIKIN